ncbi:MAG: hypothetical protein JXB62_20845 [Pirellulales bacterium]|nr:hypothetical protein [Pirellulales bacterium]
MVWRRELARQTVRLAICVAVALVCARGQAGLTIRFDYTYDGNGLFDDPARRELLEVSAGLVNRFIDDLDAIVPSSSDHWSYYVPRPDDPNFAFVDDDTIPADTVKIYVGGRDLSANYLALASLASTWLVDGSDDWENTIAYRGEIGADADPATDYAFYAGSITFNTVRNWHFSRTTDGLDETTVDFLTVATHELLHLLGFGPAESWNAHIADGRFAGPEAMAVGSSNNPDLVLDSVRAHWAADTLSAVGEASQEALLTPYIRRGERRLPTALDRAGLRDIGWQEAPAGDANLDRAINGIDIQAILAANLFGKDKEQLVAQQAWPALWATGDFTGDGVVNGIDIQAILETNLFGTGPYASTTPEEGAAQVVELMVGPQGLSIDTGGATVNGYVLASSSGVFRGQPADNLGLFQEDTDCRISGNLGFALDGVWRLGNVIGEDVGDVDFFSDLALSYTLVGRPGVYAARIVAVPEPCTLLMLAGGVWGLLLAFAAGRRRAR